jgi:MFS family permease
MCLRRRAERALDLLNFFLSDVRYGLGAYLGVYLLTEHGWDQASIGFALSLGGLAGLLTQAPIGAMVDAVRAKRLLLAIAVGVALLTSLAVAVIPRFWPVVVAGIVGAVAGNAIAPTLASISLGIVGPARFPRRAGRNEAMFHLGNGCLNLLILAIAPFFGTPTLFWTMAATAMARTAMASIVAVQRVPAQAIDTDTARGLASHVPSDPSPALRMPISVVAGGAESEEYRRQSRGFTDNWRGLADRMVHFETPEEDHLTIIEAMPQPGNPLTAEILQHAGLQDHRAF